MMIDDCRMQSRGRRVVYDEVDVARKWEVHVLRLSRTASLMMRKVWQGRLLNIEQTNLDGCDHRQGRCTAPGRRAAAARMIDAHLACRSPSMCMERFVVVAENDGGDDTGCSSVVAGFADQMIGTGHDWVPVLCPLWWHGRFVVDKGTRPRQVMQLPCKK